jgi:hypothetical protein
MSTLFPSGHWMPMYLWYPVKKALAPLYSLIVSDKTYTTVMPTFLTTGKERNLEFIKGFKYTTPEVLENTLINKDYSKNDVRNAVIAYIKSGMKNPLCVNW